jgi:hypothetical protein
MLCDAESFLHLKDKLVVSHAEQELES